MKKFLKTTSLFILISLPSLGWAQTDQPVAPAPAEDTLANSVAKLQHDVAALKQLKFSGYVQAQFQYCDSTGINSFAGGNFPAGTDKRFTIRRGRLKATYTGNFTTGVVQVDATERGVAVMEAYAVATEPWMKAVSLTAGIFNRPFGYEIGMSSSVRETPERGRMSQILFPGERDLGAMVTFQMPKESAFNWFKIQGGMFNGTGRTASDFDTHKDFIGQLIITRTNKSETFKYSGGISYYDGGERQFTQKIWHVENDTTGAPIFMIDSTSSNVGKYARRQYIGADVQLSLNWIGGITTIRAEYIQGTEPGTNSSTAAFTSAPTATTDIYTRNFNGAYIYFTQNIMQTKHQIVVKYDWYDPDTEVEGDKIKSASKFTSADIKYSTIGFGYIYHWDHNVKFMVYYDMVTNENTKLTGFTRDVKDNVLTIRMQYKF